MNNGEGGGPKPPEDEGIDLPKDLEEAAEGIARGYSEFLDTKGAIDANAIDNEIQAAELDELVEREESEEEERAKSIALDRFDNSEVTLSTANGPKRRTLASHIYETANNVTAIIKEVNEPKLSSLFELTIPREEWPLLVKALRERASEAQSALENSDLEQRYDRADQAGQVPKRLKEEYMKVRKPINMDLLAAKFIEERIEEVAKKRESAVSTHARLLQRLRGVDTLFGGESKNIAQLLRSLLEISKSTNEEDLIKTTDLREKIKQTLSKTFEPWEIKELRVALEEEINDAKKKIKELEAKEDNGRELTYADIRRIDENESMLRYSQEELDGLSLL